MHLSHAPFCIFRRKTKSGYRWYVRYWDTASRRYAVIRSTGVFAKGKTLSAGYLRSHRDDTRLHIAPFPGFQDITLRQLTPGPIREWMLWATEKGLKHR